MIIKIHNLRAATVLGIHLHERGVKREVIINIEVEYDAAPVYKSGDIRDTLDYSVLERDVLQAAAARDYDLVETLVKTIGELVLIYRGVLSVKIGVYKAGCLNFAEGVLVEDVFFNHEG